MHRTGLWQKRYETVTSSTRASAGGRAATPEIVAIKEKLEAAQKVDRQTLGKGDAKSCPFTFAATDGPAAG